MIVAVEHAAGWWTSNRVLVILTCVLAVASLGSVIGSLWLARSAKDQADATRETVKTASDQLELGRESLAQERAALQASIKPLLADVPLGVYVSEQQDGFSSIGIRMRNPDKGRIWWYRADDNSIYLDAPIRNIGSGPAFVNAVQVMAGPGNVAEALLDHQVIPVGELAKVSATFLPGEPSHGQFLSAFIEGHVLAVGVRYSDSGGSQRIQSVIYFTFEDTAENPQQRDGAVTKVEFYECDERWVRMADPYLSTGAS